MNTLKEAARLNDTSYTHLFGQGALVDGDQLVAVSAEGQMVPRSQSVPVLATEDYVRRLPDKLPVLRVAETHGDEALRPKVPKVDSVLSSISMASTKPNPAHLRRLHKRGTSLPRLATAHLPYTAEQQRVRMEWQQHRVLAGDATVGQKPRLASGC